MRPVAYDLAWNTGGEQRRLHHEGMTSLVNDELRLQVEFDGETMHVVIEPLRPLLVERLSIRFEHDFTRGARCLMNGWQSWTATDWVEPDAREWGLERVPRPIVEHYVLDGSGDYRFYDYDARPGHLHGWTWTEIRDASDAEEWLVASLDESHGFTLIEADTRSDAVTLQTEPPTRELRAGERTKLAAYLVLHGQRERAFDRWFDIAGIGPRTTRPLCGYSSWYRHYGTIDEAKLLHDLEGMKQTFSSLALHDASPVFQIDDGWTKVGDWLEPDLCSFPHGMDALAKSVSKIALPGIWFAPFVCEHDSRLFHQHPSWILRDQVGRPVRTGSHWSGAYALDTLNEQVRTYVRKVIRTVTGDWGYRFLKLDFLYAACMVPHGGMNRGELMADAVSLVRQATGDAALIDGCGVPLASAFGKFDYCRIGCDVGLDWDGAPPMRLLDRERVSTRNSLGCTIARAPLDGRAYGCDPDVVFLRDDVRISRKRRETLLEADARNASMLFTSDNLGSWSDGQIARYQQAIDEMTNRRARP